MKMRAFRIPVATVLGMIAVDAGLDPALIWTLTFSEFATRVEQAKARQRWS